MVFQEGPPVCWLFLPGRLFVGWSAVRGGKTFGWPISVSIVTAASDKARPASRKPEIYPPAFHHSFTIKAHTHKHTEGGLRGITGTWINKNHMESIQIVQCTHNMCVCVWCVHRPTKTSTILTCAHWPKTVTKNPQYNSWLFIYSTQKNLLWLTLFSLKSFLQCFSHSTWTVG